MNSHPHDIRKCREMFGKLSEYVDNELDELTCHDIERHALECIRCKTCLETLKRTIAFCKNSDTKPVPEMFSRKLKELVQGLL